MNMSFAVFLDPQNWVILLILTALELILGIDNLVFISIISRRLPPAKQKFARRIGLLMAMVTRLIFLACAFLIIKLTFTLFVLFNISFSIRDLVFIGGGLFLLIKSFEEIKKILSKNLETLDKKKIKSYSSTFGVVTQIMIFDIIFSLDSVITAIGISDSYLIMAISIIIAILGMIWASEIINTIITKHKRIKMIALVILGLIATMLIADGFDIHMPREYLYSAMIFCIFIEFLNIWAERSSQKRSKLK